MPSGFLMVAIAANNSCLFSPDLSALYSNILTACASRIRHRYLSTARYGLPANMILSCSWSSPSRGAGQADTSIESVIFWFVLERDRKRLERNVTSDGAVVRSFVSDAVRRLLFCYQKDLCPNDLVARWRLGYRRRSDFGESLGILPPILRSDLLGR